MEGKRNKVKVFLQENLGLEAAKSLLREHIDQKERTLTLNSYKELKLWEDQIYINEEFSKYTVEKRKTLFKHAK